MDKQDNLVGTGRLADACPNCADYSVGSALCTPCRYDIISAGMSGSVHVGPVRLDRPFYVHTCLSCGSRYSSDLLLSPAANQHMCPNSDMRGIRDESGYYDNWDEPEVPGAHFTYAANEPDVDNYDMFAHVAAEREFDTYFGRMLP